VKSAQGGTSRARFKKKTELRTTSTGATGMEDFPEALLRTPGRGERDTTPRQREGQDDREHAVELIWDLF